MTDDLVRFFPVWLTDGRCLVVERNIEGGVAALHATPISAKAGVAMARELAEPFALDDCPRNDEQLKEYFGQMAAMHELQAQLQASLVTFMDDELLHAVAHRLAAEKPWERCHQPPAPGDNLPF